MHIICSPTDDVEPMSLSILTAQKLDNATAGAVPLAETEEETGQPSIAKYATAS